MPRGQHRTSKFDDLNHPRLATNQRRHGEPRLQSVLGFDNGPATVHTAQAAPIEMIEIAGRIDQVDQVSAILFRVRRFDEVAIHEPPRTRSRADGLPAGKERPYM
jgi:hypothetical protein